MKLLFVLISGLLSASAIADCPVSGGELSLDHDKFGIKERVDPADKVLCRDGYMVGYSYYYKNPLWVAYHIKKDSVEGGVGRTKSFKEDRDIPEEFRSTAWDYKYSGFDRGHMAPSATMDYTKTARNESYLYSNMTPQRAGLNQKGWSRLESFVRDIAEVNGEVFVVTGAIFDGVNETIGKGVYVPSHLYKAIYVPSRNQYAAFIIPNQDFQIKDLKKYQVKVDDVERRSGLDLFHKVDNDIEKNGEKSKVDYCDFVADLDNQPEACE